MTVYKLGWYVYFSKGFTQYYICKKETDGYERKEAIRQGYFWRFVASIFHCIDLYFASEQKILGPFLFQMPGHTGYDSAWQQLTWRRRDEETDWKKIARA